MILYNEISVVYDLGLKELVLKDGNTITGNLIFFIVSFYFLMELFSILKVCSGYTRPERCFGITAYQKYLQIVGELITPEKQR